MLLPLLIGGYLASVLLTKATGIAMGPGRMATLVGYAFVGALLTDLIAGPLLGAYANSHFWILWPIFALITAAVAMFAAALLRVLGVWGTLVVFVLFIILGGSSAGGAGIPLLPSFWHAIGPYLPPQNAVVLIRNTLYFDGNGTTHAFVALGLFLLARCRVRCLSSTCSGRRRLPRSPRRRASRGAGLGPGRGSLRWWARWWSWPSCSACLRSTTPRPIGTRSPPTCRSAWSAPPRSSRKFSSTCP